MYILSPRLRKIAISATGIASVFSLMACGFNASPVNSSVKTVNFPQTPSKKQSIGNCWIYAVMGWVESMALKASNGANNLNLSESYLTYRYFQDQLNSYIPEEISEGGSFYKAISLIEKYGLMNEGDFAPSEANEPRSSIQERAVADLNKSLKDGELAKLRDSRLSRSEKSRIINEELNKAFNVDIDTIKSKIINIKTLNVMSMKDNKLVSLYDVVAGNKYNYSDINVPSNNWRPSSADKDKPVYNDKISSRQTAVLRKVYKALNEGYPVILSWFVDFNARDDKGSFNFPTLKEAGAGRQGYHLTVIEDYVVKGIDPSTGKEFFIGEGDATPEQKLLAEKYGELEYFVIKNSWGVSPTNTYQRDGEFGYHKLMKDYLFAWMPLKNEKTGEIEGHEMGLNGFNIPDMF